MTHQAKMLIFLDFLLNTLNFMGAAGLDFALKNYRGLARAAPITVRVGGQTDVEGPYLD